VKSLFTLLLFFSCIHLLAQSENPLRLDTLREKLSVATDDTSKVLIMVDLVNSYGYGHADSSFFYVRRIFELSEKANYTYGKFLGYQSLFSVYNSVGDYPKTLESQINALKIAEQLPNRRLHSMAMVHMYLGFVYREMGYYNDNITHHHLAVQLQKESGRPMSEIASSYMNTSVSYLALKMPDSAWSCVQEGYELSRRAGNLITINMSILGSIEEGLGKNNEAMATYHSAVEQERKQNADNNYFLVRVYNNLAELHFKMGHTDSSIYYGHLALFLSQRNNYRPYERDAADILSQSYETKHEQDSVVKYMKIMIAANDSVFSQSRLRQFQNIGFSEEQRQQEINIAEEKYQDRVRFYILVTALGVFLLIAFILYRNNREKQKANVLLRDQKQEIERTLADLKIAQAQLVQSEKMASLGELTAGIAHEIQNPLNFVNNFSEVNKDLLFEMKDEMDKGHIKEAQGIADDVIVNEQKINHHGKRADLIVKGMLQHAQSSTGKKELTDLNALADEYLRLAHHGFRAKEKSFDVTLKTDFDGAIGKINIVPQDIGRVLINLYNNSFYAVNERNKQLPVGYIPTVLISTKKVDDKIEVRIKDNGDGIPEKVLDKIFQPFFTSKPSGQGIGLGLSLSYDIVKAHAGELKVESKEGEGAEFVVQIPEV
jgi:two-component system, NtrC family, sensor kinase